MKKSIYAFIEIISSMKNANDVTNGYAFSVAEIALLARAMR